MLSSSSCSSSFSSLSSSLSPSVFQGHHKDIPRTIVSRTCVLNASVLGTPVSSTFVSRTNVSRACVLNASVAGTLVCRTIVSRTCVQNPLVLGTIVSFSRKDSIYFQFPIHEIMFHLNLFAQQNHNKYL